ncbi:MAG TPA: ABC transporter permease, partial [Phycisphaerae bacterium]|nr:ABC transporter permease [Phycisphaerae bacterium]
TANARRRSSGTGGFALMGTAAIPLFEDPNTEKGLRELKVPPDRFADLAEVRFVPIRVREGDDASCLNLNRAQRPQLLGVNPAELAQRKAFQFAQAAEGFSIDRGWSLLEEPAADGAVPGVADENTVVWALHKKVGETIDYVDEQGRPFKVRIVAVIANSILQGSILISERAFIERFPSQGGYRMFLIDAPADRTEEVRRTLLAAGVDLGLELTTTVDRLAEFSQVQNTYLAIFQALGGLGLILGSVGMGVVVMRNVLERRGELALMQAVGYPRQVLHRLLLTEHAALLLAGVAFGVVAAIAAVWPALRSGGAAVPYALLAALLAGVLASGLAFTWLATRAALSGPLIPALRTE